MPQVQAPTDLLGIDWGTSNRRAWWLDRNGLVLAEHSDEQGLLASQGRFVDAYQGLRAAGPSLPEDVPVLMSGMVGAASGWVEAPYMVAGLPLDRLVDHLRPVPQAGPRSFIVPGLCWTASDGSVDVMRGEETQLLGALALGHGDGWYLLPGTHSKWVRLHARRVAELATYMTGELFGLLTRHGTLASVTHDNPLDATTQAQAFERGLAAAGRSALSNALFGCRAQVVAGRMPAAQGREYLSGLLIGAEWQDVRRRAGGVPAQVTLIGDLALTQRHAQAAEIADCRLVSLDARSVQLAALQALRAGM